MLVAGLNAASLLVAVLLFAEHRRLRRERNTFIEDMSGKDSHRRDVVGPAYLAVTLAILVVSAIPFFS